MRVLITGGTGTFGHAYLKWSRPRWDRLYVYSRDEQKQYAMRMLDLPGVRLILGDIRDPEKLRMAMRNVDVVIHAAALKIVPHGTWNPDEMILTNCIGTMNVIRAAANAGVRKVVVISTDKAVEPTTLYGATKMCQEHLAVQANEWAAPDTRISCVRYGNVIDSRGSFTLKIDECVANEEAIPITDMKMTRFWIDQRSIARFVDHVIDNMEGGEIFVPKMAATRIVDLCPPNALLDVIGRRPTEKLHETVVGEHELPHTDEFETHFVIRYWPYKGRCRRTTPYRSDEYEGLGGDPDAVGLDEDAAEVPGDDRTDVDAGAALPPRDGRDGEAGGDDA